MVSSSGSLSYFLCAVCAHCGEIRDLPHRSRHRSSDIKLPHAPVANRKRADGASYIWPQRDDEVRLIRIAGLLDVRRRWDVFGGEMRMILAEMRQFPIAQGAKYIEQFTGGNFVGGRAGKG